MKVLLISHDCYRHGIAQQTARLLGTYSDIELQVVVPKVWHHSELLLKYQHPIDATFEFTPLEVGGLDFFKPHMHWYPGLHQVMIESKPDIIDVCDEPSHLLIAHACWLKNRIVPKAKFICETEENFPVRVRLPSSTFRRYVFGKTDLIVNRSANALEVIKRDGYAGPCAIVPTAVDTEMFRPMDHELCRTHLDVSGFVVGYVGPLNIEHGLSELVAAIALLPPSVNLLIVGNGPYQPQIRGMIHSLKISDRVRIMPPVSSRQLPQIYNAIDVLAAPFRTTHNWRELIGTQIIQAMSCGLPIVGSYSGAIPQIIGDGGLIVPERNAKALADGLKIFFDAPNAKHEMGTIARSTILQKFHPAVIADRMHQLYTNTLESSAPKTIRVD